MESIWTNTALLPQFPKLHGDKAADVLIIGGGMAGLLCARKLTDAGASCILLEARQIGSGITKNTTAKITSQHGLLYHQLEQRFGLEAAGQYLEANQSVLAEFASLCEAIPCGYEAQDNFIYSRNDPAALEQELEALQRLRFPARLARKLPLPFPTVGAVQFPGQAQFHPLQFLAGISQGLTIYEKSPVRELMPHRAVTDNGSVTAKAIIIATHFPMLNKHGSYFLKLYQQRSYVLALGNVPHIPGMYLDEAKNGLSLRSYEGQLLLGGGGHRTGKPGGGWRELEDAARKYFPGAKITHRWATQDCMSLDGLPYIGQYSSRTPGLYVATGFNKWGMTNSMVAATVLTDLITTGSSPYKSLFSPSRSVLRPQLALNALESTKNLVTPTVPRCPHLGCALKWNSQEHSWDCPCHGSRFEKDGKLIDNPATGNLKKRD